MKKSRFISYRTLKLHELHRTFRLLHPPRNSYLQGYDYLRSIQKKAISNFLRFIGASAVVYLLLSNMTEAGSVGYQSTGFTAEIPVAFILLFASVLIHISALSGQSLFMILQYKSWYGARFRIHGFTMNAYDYVSGDEETSLAQPIITNHFGKNLEFQRYSSRLACLFSY